MPAAGLKSGNSICKLCLNSRPLCNSHILPEFMFKPLYEESPRRLLEIRTGEETHVKSLQKGVRERLLCQQCETRLSNFETYAKKVLFDEVEYEPGESTGNVIYYKNIEYDKFKLFQLSVLWRASVARHETFQKVSLGPHEEKVRQMLFNSDPGEPEQYPCLMVGIISKGSPLQPIISPDETEFDGLLCYRFVMAGLMWIFLVPSAEPAAPWMQNIIKKNGQIKLQWVEACKLNYFCRLSKDLRNDGRFDDR